MTASLKNKYGHRRMSNYLEYLPCPLPLRNINFLENIAFSVAFVESVRKNEFL